MDMGGMHVNTVDLIALGVIAFFLVNGLLKGFAFQVVRLVTFLVALIVAKQYAGSSNSLEPTGFSGQLMDWFPNQLDNRTVAVYLAFFIIFIGILILGTLIGFLFRSLLKRLELRSFDRILGGLLGAAAGVTCVTVIISCLVFVSPDSELMEWIGPSHTMRLSGEVIQVAKPFFPAELRDEMNLILSRIEAESGKRAAGRSEGDAGDSGSGR